MTPWKAILVAAAAAGFLVAGSWCGIGAHNDRDAAYAAPQILNVRLEAAEKDPVCGMDVDPAKAAGKSEYKGKTYYFCSAHCKRTFDQDPEKQLKKKEAEKPPSRKSAAEARRAQNGDRSG